MVNKDYRKEGKQGGGMKERRWRKRERKEGSRN